MTVDLAVAIVSLLASALVAGRVVFRTEVTVEQQSRRLDEHSGKIAALDAIAAEERATQAGLSERVAGLANNVDGKASAESVAAVKESVEGFRRDVMSALERIERKVDTHPQPPR